ncbi:unnamed protein product, partial [Urochloa humidicola]
HPRSPSQPHQIHLLAALRRLLRRGRAAGGRAVGRAPAEWARGEFELLRIEVERALAVANRGGVAAANRGGASSGCCESRWSELWLLRIAVERALAGTRSRWAAAGRARGTHDRRVSGWAAAEQVRWAASGLSSGCRESTSSKLRRESFFFLLLVSHGSLAQIEISVPCFLVQSNACPSFLALFSFRS